MEDWMEYWDNVNIELYILIKQAKKEQTEMLNIKKTYRKAKRNLMKRSIKISNSLHNQEKYDEKLHKKYEYFK